MIGLWLTGFFEWQIREWSIDHYGLDPLGGLMMKDKSRSEHGKVDALNSGVITHATFFLAPHNSFGKKEK